MAEGQLDFAERQAFMDEYAGFWKAQGKDVPPCSVRWQAEPLDVFALFKEVEKLGGSKTVGEKNMWRTVGEAFNPPSASKEGFSFPAPAASRAPGL